MASALGVSARCTNGRTVAGDNDLASLMGGIVGFPDLNACAKLNGRPTVM